MFTFLSFSSLAQDDKNLKEALAKLDTSAFKGKAFLNKAVFVKSLIEVLRSKEKNADGSPIFTIAPNHFKLLTNIIANADLNDKPKPKAIANIQQRTIDEITRNNISAFVGVFHQQLMRKHTQ